LVSFLAFEQQLLLFLRLIKFGKQKITKDISLWMFLIFTAGVAGWLVYGVLTDNLPIIFANIVTLFLAFLILVAKIKFN
jgi:MtN3 and saliva related transmembrane protein